MNVVIIKYNAGNTCSVANALERLGVQAEITSNKDKILAADKVIFPGVGHAKSAMESLKENGLHTLLPQLKQPVLGICLGMQLMCSFSEEGDTDCLGIFDVNVQKFQSNSIKIPHMGWNSVSTKKAIGLFDGISNDAYFYHVHSYFVANNSFAIATCNYDQQFATAMQKDNFYAVQFHPEKSAAAGQQLLKNFIAL